MTYTLSSFSYVTQFRYCVDRYTRGIVSTDWYRLVAFRTGAVLTICDQFMLKCTCHHTVERKKYVTVIYVQAFGISTVTWIAKLQVRSSLISEFSKWLVESIAVKWLPRLHRIWEVGIQILFSRPTILIEFIVIFLSWHSAKLCHGRFLQWPIQLINKQYHNLKLLAPTCRLSSNKPQS